MGLCIALGLWRLWSEPVIYAFDPEDDGWARLSTVGSLIAKNSPSFDSRNYGYQKLSELVRKQSYLEVREVPVASGSGGVHLYLRLKGK